MKSFLTLAIALVGSRLAYLLVLPPETYSIDVVHWLHVLQELEEGRNPYVTTPFLNWPPLWLGVLYAMERIAETFSCQVVTVLRALLICLEVVILWILYRTLLHFGNSRDRTFWILLCGWSLNPLMVFLTIQQGQFDLLVGLCVMQFFLWVDRFLLDPKNTDWLWASFWAGLGILTKTVPIVLLPFLSLGVDKLRPVTLGKGFLLALLPAGLAMAILWSLSPEAVDSHVFRYTSISGYYGVSGLLNLFELPEYFTRTYSQLFVGALLVVLILTSKTVRESSCFSRTNLLALTAALFLFLPTFGPGYSPSYIQWSLPLLILLFSSHQQYVALSMYSFYAVACCTYLVEYAFFSTHGAFLVKMIQSAQLVDLSNSLSLAENQTLLRLPLFIVSLWLLLKTVCLAFKKDQTVTDSNTPDTPQKH